MKIKNKLFAVIAMVLCVGSFTGCAKKEAAEEMDATIKEQLASTSSQTLEALASFDDATISQLIGQYEDNDDSAMVDSLNTWITTKDEVGGYVSVNGTSAVMKDKQYVCTVDAAFEKRPMQVTLYYDKKGSITSMEFAPEYKITENLQRAAVHTLIGMGTVFCVLIFISLIISGFKYINAWEAGQKAKNAPAPAAPAPVAAPVAEESEDLVDDLELVAVITAAIAASLNTSTDGLVVRSIRRKSGAKWKKA